MNRVVFCLLLLGAGLLSISPMNARADDLLAQITASKVQSKLGSELQRLSNQYSLAVKSGSNLSATPELVTIDATAKTNVNELLMDLRLIGLKHGSAAGLVVSGSLPLSSLTEASKLESLHHVTLSRMDVRQGSVTSQGFTAMHVGVANTESSLDGTGITVGVISDSYNCYAISDDPQKLQRTAELDKASGDIPSDSYALEEANNCSFRTDEGRALMQIIHDIAPKTKLVFLAGGNGIAPVVNGIARLINEIRVDIIVDDTAIGSETYFQDGLIAQAIDSAVQQGVTYITAVGNSGRNSYQSRYREVIDNALNINAHNFAENGRIDVLQKFTLPEGATINLSLQWSDPAYSVSGPPGAQTDLDLYIVNEKGTQIVESSASINISKDPIEFLSFTNPEGSDQSSFNIMISKSQGDSPELFKYIIEQRFEGKVEEYETDSGTTVGRANTESAISVGAVDYQKTPAFGASTPVLQFFSSAGGDTPILFGPTGNRLAAPQFRAKPDVVGPDNINTTFFNYLDPEGDIENDLFPNFLGTSASAPHVAGVAALLLQLNPDFLPQDIKTILQASAIDVLLRDEQAMSQPQSIGTGVDDDSGSGFVDASAAIKFARNHVPTRPDDTIEPGTINQISDDEQALSEQSFVFTGTGNIDIYTLVLIICFFTSYRIAAAKKF
ncbi:MAG: S8 family serine peptidase [Gammaproteobacteria bacterium]|nr:S8 family serine peptidase [Gammaproteobacteria bacterium]